MPLPARVLGRHARELHAAFARARRELDVPEAFPEEAAEEAARVADGPIVATGSRRDARDLPLVTIDPAGSRDLDQALAVRRRPHARGFRVHYAIADVGAYVVPGGALDAAARARALTLYCPDVRTPLHPTVLSEGAASLLPGEVRPALLWTLDLDADGAHVRTGLERAVVRSRAQVSYAEAQRRLDDRPHPEDPLAALAEVGRLRVARLAEGGAITLDVPDQEVDRDGDGGYRLAFREHLPVERWNEQVSLLTGLAAGRLFAAAGVGIVRTLPSPDDEVVTALRRTATELGVPLQGDLTLGAALARIDTASPRGAALATRSARLFRGAGYTVLDGSSAPPRHAGVGGVYAHVTAPLRRLVDRFASAAALAVAAERPLPGWVAEALPELPAAMTRGARLAGALDRAVIAIVEAAVLAGRVGDVLEGVVVDRRGEDRVIVQLTDVGVLEPVTVDDAGGAGGAGDAGGAELGEQVRVRVVASDPVAGAVELTLV